MTKLFKTLDFIKNKDESCVHEKVNGSRISFLMLYVDDILLIGDDINMWTLVKAWLSSTFSIRNFEEAKYILQIRIYRGRAHRMMGLSQALNFEKVLKNIGIENHKKVFLPMRHGVHLSKSISSQSARHNKEISVVPYAFSVNSMMYAILCTRSDICDQRCKSVSG